MTDPLFVDAFNPGSSLKIEIGLENFTPADGEIKDFRVNYAFSFNYYDTTPESVPSVLGFTVNKIFGKKILGADLN